MSTNFYKKIEKIRKAENLSQAKLCKVLDVNLSAYEKARQRKSEAKGNLLRKVCNKFPEYTLWLMTGIVQPENDQISPEIKLKTQELKKHKKA